MIYGFCIAVLFVADALATGAGVLLFRNRWGGGGQPLPLVLAVPAAAGAAIVHGLAAWPLMHVVGDVPMEQLLGRVALPFVFGALPPTLVYGWAVAEAFGEALGTGIAGWGGDAVRPFPSDFSKAQTLAATGDVDGALCQYRRYFQEDPYAPDPLLAAAALLTQHRRYDEAGALCREAAGHFPSSARPALEEAGILAAQKRYEEAADRIRGVLNRFRGDDVQWAHAAYRLSEVLEYDLKDPGAAAFLLREVARRAPRTTQGRDAQERLARPPHAP